MNNRKPSFSFGIGFVIRSNNAGTIVLTGSHVVQDINLAADDRLYVRAKRPISVVLHKHRHIDVAIPSVPALRNVQSLNFAPVMDDAVIIGVGFPNPESLFTGIQMAMKRFSDLSPDSFISILFVCHFVSSLD